MSECGLHVSHCPNKKVIFIRRDDRDFFLNLTLMIVFIICFASDPSFVIMAENLRMSIFEEEGTNTSI